MDILLLVTGPAFAKQVGASLGTTRSNSMGLWRAKSLGFGAGSSWERKRQESGPQGLLGAICLTCRGPSLASQWLREYPFLPLH